MSTSQVSAAICPVDCWIDGLVSRHVGLQIHNMRLVTIKRDAERLISEHGLVAHAKAVEGARAARRRRNIRLEKYLTKVAQEIMRRAEIKTR